MDRGGNDVVRRLPAIDVVIRVRLRNRADHLVGVHVGRGAAAGLENVDREMIVELAIGDATGSGPNAFGGFFGKVPEIGVDLRGGAFDQAHGANERARKTQATDWEVFDRALRLSAIEGVFGDAHFAHGVALNAMTLAHADQCIKRHLSDSVIWWPRMEWIWWAPLPASAAHITEEFFFPGGFADWDRAYRPEIRRSITKRFHIIINAALLVLGLNVALAGAGATAGGTRVSSSIPPPLAVPAWFALAALLASNAVWHVIGTIRTRRYSPGVCTGVLL